MEELKRFQGSTLDTVVRRKLFEDQDIILEPSGKIQDLQNEINYCMNESKNVQDAESVRSGHSHVTSQLVYFPIYPVPGGMLSRPLGMPSRQAFGTHGLSGNVSEIQSRFLQRLSAGIESIELIIVRANSLFTGGED